MFLYIFWYILVFMYKVLEFVLFVRDVGKKKILLDYFVFLYFDYFGIWKIFFLKKIIKGYWC